MASASAASPDVDAADAVDAGPWGAAAAAWADEGGVVDGGAEQRPNCGCT